MLYIYSRDGNDDYYDGVSSKLTLSPLLFVYTLIRFFIPFASRAVYVNQKHYMKWYVEHNSVDIVYDMVWCNAMLMWMVGTWREKKGRSMKEVMHLSHSSLLIKHLIFFILVIPIPPLNSLLFNHRTHSSLYLVLNRMSEWVKDVVMCGAKLLVQIIKHWPSAPY